MKREKIPNPNAQIPKGGFRVRHWVREEDYPLVCEWWAGHGVPAVGSGLLPECGLVVEADGEAVLAAWLYQDNSCGVGWLGWFIGRPGARLRVMSRALDVLLGAAEEVMRSQQRHTLLVMTDRRGIGRACVRRGFVPAHSATEYWRVL
jgi:hypothetical protein